jgi:hypothetical protein
MSLSQTEMIEYLRRIRNIKRGAGFIDTSKVENDFLYFSSRVGRGILNVTIPRQYILNGDDGKKIAEALKTSRIDLEIPSEIGISGGFNGIANNQLFLVSPNQFNTDYSSHSRAYLTPLLIKIYGEGTKLLRDFTVHEALYGEVKCFSGELDLKDIGLFPEKFIPGKYKLSVEIDTPNSSVKKFVQLRKLMQELKENKEQFLKSENKVAEMTERILELRSVIGSLSRYEDVETNVFSSETDSCVIENERNNYFYLYNPQQNKNVLVYFGDSPISKTPLDLNVINGEDRQSALASLLSFDFYKVSPAILDQRIKDLNAMYEGAARAEKRNISGEHADFGKFLEKLKMNQRVIQDMANEEARKNFALTQPPEILEFLVCPSNENPVVHDLLTHLSWNTSLREYHDTRNFIQSFEKADKKTREKILKRAVYGISFANQQNNDVNFWLYQNYRGFCQSLGIEFNVLK